MMHVDPHEKPIASYKGSKLSFSCQTCDSLLSAQFGKWIRLTFDSISRKLVAQINPEEGDRKTS
jgi:hypothetical protein